MKLLPGFRDFFPEGCARRNAMLTVWRETARRHGYVEYDGPVLEETELYRRKSGGELAGQLFQFEDKGGRDVSMRPEMTPTLVRMVIDRERHYRKPLKWFSIASFFRYEKQQRGRLREFIQFNADLIGEPGPQADADLIALTVDLFRACGLGEEDFCVRLSSRDAWAGFLAAHGIPEDATPVFLSIVDKLERLSAADLEQKLVQFGVSAGVVREFIEESSASVTEPLGSVMADLSARGLGGYCRVDPGIVRGLAYYTGTVFEVFDRGGKFRAMAGGGRYDKLLRELSGGGVDLPAIGVGVGDAVLSEVLAEKKAGSARLASLEAAALSSEVFLVVADELHRGAALALSTVLRDTGWRVEFSSREMKVGRQFQAAEQAGARFAVVIGSEWPQAKIKVLATREEIPADAECLVGLLARLDAAK